MAIGIFGLPRTGKTTIFNSVTRGHADTGGSRAGGAQPHVGIVKVPDPRLGVLAEISHPKQVIPAEVEYIDVPQPPRASARPRASAAST